jgi:hypothetical protein
MEIRNKQWWIVTGLTVIVFIVSALLTSEMPNEKTETSLFLTLGLDQTQLENETSSYEIQRSLEHFTDVVLGWTIEPSFSNDFPQSFTGVKQEKQNLLFIIDDADPRSADLLSLAILERLNEYNEASNSGFVIAVERSTTIDRTLYPMRIVFGAWQ